MAILPTAAFALLAAASARAQSVPREEFDMLAAVRAHLPAQGLMMSGLQEERAPLEFQVTALRRFTHAGSPWTQGLEFSKDGRLIETCGDYPQGVGSFVRVLDPQTGSVQRSINDGLVDEWGRALFIEGITEKDRHWFATTYNDKKVVEYDSNFKVVGTRPYAWEGWGLTVSLDDQSFLVTNGSAHVMSLSASDWQLQHVGTVNCMGRRIEGLNELEMVDDFEGMGPTLLGNVINSRLVLALNPTTMSCTGVLHLEDLEEVQRNEHQGYHVANGIAYNKKTKSFFVTGKNWQSMYEVKISKPSVDFLAGRTHGGSEGRAMALLRARLMWSRPA